MELRQLEYFIAIAEERSFTRAAMRVRVAQPAVSQQIRQLERELRQTLFDRSDRPVSLTTAGRELLPHARAALNAARDGRDAVASVSGTLTGRLAIGTVPLPPPWFTAAIGDFHERYPVVEISLRSAHASHLAEQVSAGALDVAVIGLGGQPLPAMLATQPLGDEPVVLVARADHPFGRRAGVALPELEDQPLVTLRPGSGLRALLEAACAKQGFTPNIRAETDDLPLLAELARQGIGVALMPRSAVPADLADLHVLTVRKPVLRRKLALAWSRNRLSAPSTAFLELLSSTRRDSARGRRSL